MSTLERVQYLQPASLGRLIDRAVYVYRANFITLIGIIALMQIPLALAQIAVNVALAFSGVNVFTAGFDPTAEVVPQGFGLYYVAQLTMGLLNVVLVGGIATAAVAKSAAASLLGQKHDIIASYQAIGQDWPRVLAAIVVAGAINIVAFILTFLIPCAGWVVGPGFLYFFSVVIVGFVPIVVVLEGHGPFAAIRRAWDLARRRFWWLVAFTFLLFLFSRLALVGPINILAGGLGALIGSGAIGITDPQLIQAITTTVGAVLQSLTAVFYLPVQITALLLAYFDVRIRSEGFDITLLSTPADTSPFDVTREAPPPRRGGLVTWEEIGYFSIMTMGFIGLIIVSYGIIFALALAILGAFAGSF